MFRLVVLVLLLGGCASSSQPNLSLNTSDRDYYAQVEAVKAEPTIAKLVSLREAFVASSLYQPYGGPEATHSHDVMAAMNAGEWDECLEAVEQVLAQNYTNLLAHYGAMVCGEQNGQAEFAAYHDTILNGLVEAIWTTGDGTSEQTAFSTNSTPELQAFIKLQGLDTVAQALVESDAGMFDKMTVINGATGVEFDMYFSIQNQFENFMNHQVP